MKKGMMLLMLSSFAMLSGCASMPTNADWDTSVSFEGLKTYNWAVTKQPESSDPRLNSEILDSRIRSAVDRTLSAQGFQKTVENPDLWVSYHTAIKEKLDVTTIDTPYYGSGPVSVRGGIPTYDPGWSSFGHTDTFVTQYEEGTLLVDFIDPAHKKLIWRGSVSAVVDPDATPQKRETRINTAVGKVLALFPPK